MASEIKVDTISEKTSANGVSIDSVVHKDSAVYPSSADGGALGSASNEWSDLFLADSSVIKFGADQDTTLTHTDGTGLTLNSTNKLCFNDASQFVQGSSATVLSIGATDEIDLTATAVDLNGTLDVSGNSQFSGTITVGVDDTGKDVKLFGASSGSYALWDESANALNLVASTLGVVSAKDLGIGIHIKTADSGGSIDNGADELVIENSGNAGITILSGTSSGCNINMGDSGSSTLGGIQYNNNNNQLTLKAGGNVVVSAITSEFVINEGSNDQNFRVESNNDPNALLIDAGSDFIRFFGTAASLESNSGNDYGMYSDNNGETVFSTNASSFKINRQNSDGSMVTFYQEGSNEGSISVSGTTISYGAFCGSHWSRLADNLKPTILRGTIMESIATMMDWYQVEYETDITKEYKDGDTIPLGKEIGDEYTDKTSYKESIALPDGKSVGDNHTVTIKGVERTGKIIKEGNEQLPMCKISDTADSKAVYGVFMAWDDQDDGLNGDVNDMHVASLGAFVVRVHSGETVAIGDYLQSRGDGTAKVQADDILRASTIAKVTSTEKTITHGDGSYCVPCTLHCG